MTRCTSRALPTARNLLAAALATALTGCAAGRVGGLYLLDDAVAVVDARPGREHTVVAQPGRTVRVSGRPVPTTAAQRWLVFGELTTRLRSLRTSPMRKDQRLPVWTRDYRLVALDLQTGRRRSIPNPFDGDDQQIHRLRLHRDRLFAAVSERFNVQSDPGRTRYAVYRLPEGPWEDLPDEEGRRILPRSAGGPEFADLRTAAPDDTGAGQVGGWSGIQSFADLEARGLSRGSWGELIQRKNALGGQEVVLKSPDGQERVLVRQVGPDLPRLFAPGFGQGQR